MSKTLEDVLNESEGSDIKSAFSTLANALKEEVRNQNEKEWKALTSSMESKIADILNVIKEVLAKPDPIFPEVKFPEKVFMDRPEWYKEPKEAEPINHETIATLLEQRMGKHFDALIERNGNEHQATREVLDDILNKEPEYRESDKKEPLRPAVNMGSVHKHSRWIRASTAQKNIVGAFDGINNVFYLPSAVIPNSESVRLNLSAPLETDDYSISGNKITFSVAPVAGSTCEIRFQT